MTHAVDEYDELWSDASYRAWVKRWWAADFSLSNLSALQRGHTTKTSLAFLASIPSYEFLGKEFSKLHAPYHGPNGEPGPRLKFSEDDYLEIKAMVSDLLDRVIEYPYLGGVFFDFGLEPREITSPVFANYAYFSDNNAFRGTKFLNEVKLDDAYIGYIDFEDCEFRRSFSAARATFLVADFSRSFFEYYASFQGCYFLGGAYFDSVVFKRSGDFSECQFNGDFYFTYDLGAIVSDADGRPSSITLSFYGATFFEDAVFTNRRFNAPTDFSKCKFRGVLRLYNCTLHEDTSFRDADFGPWPLSIADRIALKSAHKGLVVRRETAQSETIPLLFSVCHGGPFGDKFIYPYNWGSPLWPLVEVRLEYPWRVDRETAARHFGELEHAFRVARTACERASLKADAFRFYRLEMLARRKRSKSTDVSPLERGLSWVYELISDYGQSIARPVFWWLLIIGAGASLLSIPTPNSPVAYAYALEWSLSNAVKPFWFMGWRPDVASSGFDRWLVNVTSVDDWIEIGVKSASMIESVASIALVFMFFLAVRRRFQVAT